MSVPRCVAFAFMFALSVASASAQVPAFPGASGPAAVTAGGRGGRIMAVTTLADSGPGSLREAIEASGPRIVVFRVAGIIDLASRLLVRNGDITIAGQSAPGGGITLRGTSRFDVLDIRAKDVVIRYLRLRAVRGEPDSTDQIYIGSGAERVVLDHLSLSWANDELYSIWPTGDETVRDVTLSWSILAETLEGHATAALCGSNNDSTSIRGVVFEHNLFAHNTHRNPLVKVGQAFVVNNLVYDYSLWGVGLGGGIEADLIGNVFIAGPNTDRRADNIMLHRINPGGVPAIGPAGEPSLFVVDNVGPGCTAGDQWACVQQSNPWDSLGHSPVDDAQREAPMDPGFDFAIDPSEVLEARIATGVGANARIDEGGAWVPARDDADQRVIEEVAERGGDFVNDPSDVGGFPTIDPGAAYADEDGDGMADRWEQMHGFDASDASDGATDTDEDGYTNVEEFLNGTPPRGEAVEPDAGVTDAGMASDAGAADAGVPEDGSVARDAGAGGPDVG
ncbi:MAG: hypothetical protein AAF645_28860, partial [Myxococcota bacterium]